MPNHHLRSQQDLVLSLSLDVKLSLNYLPIKYLKILLTIFQWDSRGDCINWYTRFTMYAISDFVILAYWVLQLCSCTIEHLSLGHTTKTKKFLTTCHRSSNSFGILQVCIFALQRRLVIYFLWDKWSPSRVFWTSIPRK